MKTKRKLNKVTLLNGRFDAGVIAQDIIGSQVLGKGHVLRTTNLIHRVTSSSRKLPVKSIAIRRIHQGSIIILNVDMRSKDWGLIDIPYLWGNCNQCGGHLWPYQIQVVYNTGFSSGTSYHPDILLGLTTYAEIVLNEIAGYGNESTGDVGVQSFNNQSYSEQRTFLLQTSYGSSAKAQFIKKLVAKYKKRKFVGMI